MEKLQLLNLGNGKAEIRLYDVVDEFMLGKFIDEIKAVENLKNLDLYIHSPGGYIFEGLAIWNELKKLQKNGTKITSHCMGLCASMASVLLLSADVVKMAENARIMIHKPSGGSFGTAEDLRRSADLMDSLEEDIIKVYEKRSNLPKETLVDLVAQETWIGSKNALAWGFVDEIEYGVKVENVLTEKGSLKDMPEDLVEMFYEDKKEIENETVKETETIKDIVETENIVSDGRYFTDTEITDRTETAYDEGYTAGISKGCEYKAEFEACKVELKNLTKKYNTIVEEKERLSKEKDLVEKRLARATAGLAITEDETAEPANWQDALNIELETEKDYDKAFVKAKKKFPALHRDYVKKYN
jgi:ATP-dependent Clp endopeptidase proteolytic subunit ClpP